MVKLVVSLKDNRITVSDSEITDSFVADPAKGLEVYTGRDHNNVICLSIMSFDFDPEGFVIELIDTNGHAWSAEIV
jgi:hypothetical protein